MKEKKYKVIFSEKESEKLGGVKLDGSCKMKDRNNNGEIIIYKGSANKLKTLIHEIIHFYLFEKSKQGYKSRLIDSLNDDESFVDGLAIEIEQAISENKDQILK